MSSEKIRLNKAIASRSKFSRREADRLIADGRVNIARKVITDLATMVYPDEEIFVDGKRLAPKSEEFTVIVYNKPKGELVTKRDPEGRRTIYDSLPSRFSHFMPVGRLDYASEGLLLLSDSSEVVDRLMTSNLERVYNIKIDGFVTPSIENAMSEGLDLEDATAGAHSKTEIVSMNFAPFVAWRVEKNHPKFSKLKVILTEGKNREIRRFFGHFKRVVLDLKRVSYGNISLNALPSGKTRFLDKKEYQWLHGFLKETNPKTIQKDRNDKNNRR